MRKIILAGFVVCFVCVALSTWASLPPISWMFTGTYVGNGNDGYEIANLGFRPSEASQSYS